MKIRGHLHEIENLELVIAAHVVGVEPQAGFTDWTGAAHVRCVVRLQPESGVSAALTRTFEAETDERGRFTVELPEGLAARDAHLVVTAALGTVRVPGSGGPFGTPPVEVPVFSPIYRSASFLLDDVAPGRRHVYVAQETVPDSEGYTQAEVTEQAAALGDREDFEQVTARILTSRVDVRAEKSGAVVRFGLRLRPSMSRDLTAFVRAEADDVDVDLPGPDWITGLCVDKQDVEQQVRDAVRELGARLNDRLEATIADRAPSFVTDVITVTLRDIRHPVTARREVVVLDPAGTARTATITDRSIVGDPCIGLPRRLYPT